MIPEGWKEVHLGNVVSELRSGLSRKLSVSDIGLPMIRSSNITEQGIDYTDLKYWFRDDPQGATTEHYFLQDGDLLVNFINSIAQIGKAALYHDMLHRDVIYTTNIFRIRTNRRVLPEYLLLLTKTNEYAWYIQAITKPAVNQASFTTKDFKRFKFLLPPLPEQRAIAAILGTWDRAIALTERRLAAAEQRKTALMQQLLTGRVRFPEFVKSTEKQETKYGDLPADWKVVHLESVAEVNAESVGESSELNQKYLYVDLSSVDRGVITMPTEYQQFVDLPSRARRILHKGDVIMATVRPNLLGFAVCDFEPENVLCSTGFALISPKELLDSQFIYQSLYSDMILKQVYGLVTGSNYPAINASEVRKLWFVWPTSAEERRKIAAVLNTCDRELDLLRRKRDALQRQKTGLMQRLLTGRVRVTPQHS